MPDINPSLPVVGQPDSTEEPKVVTALSQLIAAVNDVDSDQIADGTITAADLAAAIQEALFAPGDLKATAHATADSGWLMCDGAEVSRTTYAALYAKIGDAYGAGDGTTTFLLPDFRGRVAVGKGSHTSVDALGDNDGTTLASRSPLHHHVATFNGSASGGFGTFAGAPNSSSVINVGSGPMVDTPAYLVVNYQIKT